MITPSLVSIWRIASPQRTYVELGDRHLFGLLSHTRFEQSERTAKGCADLVASKHHLCQNGAFVRWVETVGVKRTNHHRYHPLQRCCIVDAINDVLPMATKINDQNIG